MTRAVSAGRGPCVDFAGGACAVVLEEIDDLGEELGEEGFVGRDDLRGEARAADRWVSGRDGGSNVWSGQ